MTTSRRALLGLTGMTLLAACASKKEAVEPTGDYRELKARQEYTPPPPTVKKKNIPLGVLDNQTYYQYMTKLDHQYESGEVVDGDYEYRRNTLLSKIYALVDIDPKRWGKLSIKNRARRAQLYLQTMFYADSDLDTESEVGGRAKEVGYDAFVDQGTLDTLDAGTVNGPAQVGGQRPTAKGLKALRKIETIRRATEQATGLALSMDEDFETTRSENVGTNLASLVMPILEDSDPRLKETFSSSDFTYFDTDRCPRMLLLDPMYEKYQVLSYNIDDDMRIGTGRFAERGSSIRVSFIPVGNDKYCASFGWSI